MGGRVLQSSRRLDQVMRFAHREIRARVAAKAWRGGVSVAGQGSRQRRQRRQRCNGQLHYTRVHTGEPRAREKFFGSFFQKRTNKTYA